MCRGVNRLEPTSQHRDGCPSSRQRCAMRHAINSHREPTGDDPPRSGEVAGEALRVRGPQTGHAAGSHHSNLRGRQDRQIPPNIERGRRIGASVKGGGIGRVSRCQDRNA